MTCVETGALVDHFEQMLPGAQHRRDPPGLLGIQLALRVQELGVAENAVERRAQLMAHPGQEPALRPVRPFRRILRLGQMAGQALDRMPLARLMFAHRGLFLDLVGHVDEDAEQRRHLAIQAVLHHRPRLHVADDAVRPHQPGGEVETIMQGDRAFDRVDHHGTIIRVIRRDGAFERRRTLSAGSRPWMR